MEKREENRAFSLLEILVTVAIVAVLASTAIVSYLGYKERVDEMTDETNQLILQTALKIYATDTGTVAGTISKIPHRDIERACAMVTEGKKPYTMMVYLSERGQELWGGSTAEAASGQGNTFLPSKYYNNDLKVITCPRDATPPTGFDPSTGQPLGGTSYAIRDTFQNQPSSVLTNALPGAELIIESDSTDGTPGSEAYRHRGGTESIATQVDGKHIRKLKAKSTGGGSAPHKPTKAGEDRD